jgi:hypothetical protein
VPGELQSRILAEASAASYLFWSRLWHKVAVSPSVWLDEGIKKGLTRIFKQLRLASSDLWVSSTINSSGIDLLYRAIFVLEAHLGFIKNGLQMTRLW